MALGEKDLGRDKNREADKEEKSRSKDKAAKKRDKGGEEKLEKLQHSKSQPESKRATKAGQGFHEAELGVVVVGDHHLV